MSQLGSSGIVKLSAALGKAIHDHWKTFLAEGVLLVVLGLAAIVLPPIAKARQAGRTCRRMRSPAGRSPGTPGTGS